MKYLVERDLYFSKIETFINEKYEKGYKLHSIFTTETEKSESNGKNRIVANKATLIFERIA